MIGGWTIQKLKRQVREDIYEQLREEAEIGIGVASVAEIDRVNILKQPFSP